MAIKFVKRIDSSKEEVLQLRTIKQRDYTIPVRLNQLPPAAAPASTANDSSPLAVAANNSNHRWQPRQRQPLKMLNHHQNDQDNSSTRRIHNRKCGGNKLELQQHEQQQFEKKLDSSGCQTIRSAHEGLDCVDLKQANRRLGAASSAVDATNCWRALPTNRSESRSTTNYSSSSSSSSLISKRPIAFGWPRVSCSSSSLSASLASLMVIAGVIVTLTITTTTIIPINCDMSADSMPTQMERRASEEQQPLKLFRETKTLATAAAASGRVETSSLRGRARDLGKKDVVSGGGGGGKGGKKDNSSASSNNNNNSKNALLRKEHLLSYLTDNIERQHFQKTSKPVKVLTNNLNHHHHHERPSKFDSGDGGELNYGASDISANYLLPSSSYSSSSSSSLKSNHSSRVKTSSGVDEGLRQILRMHEMAASTNVQQQSPHHQHHNKHQSVDALTSTDSYHSSPLALPLVASGLSLFGGGINSGQLATSAGATTETSSSNNNPAALGGAATAAAAGFANRLRELSRAPVRVASNIIKPNRVVSNMLSYITTPLIKLSNTQQLFDYPRTSSLFNSTSSIFGGRSNNQLTLAKGILKSFNNEINNNQDKEESSSTSSHRPLSSSSLSLSKFSSLVPATSSQHISTLVKPNQLGYEKQHSSSGQRDLYQENNPSTTNTDTTTSSFFDSFGDALLKSALIKPNLSPKDLDVSDSSLSTTLSDTVGQTIGSKSNKVSEVQQASGQESSSSLMTSLNNLDDTRASKILGPAGTWLKENANKKAQNYLHDSFRGLLTLTQLPILQATPISTAPSVLEKGARKQKKPDKSSSTSSNTSSTSGNPLSAINRNRALDELYRYAYILGSGVRRKRDPLKALGVVATNQKLGGVFNQRSRNQLIQTPNEKQLLKYAKSLKSLLASGGAKPRGVMWDMASDPSLAVTVFHLLERASVALPLGFLLMPFVKMIHNPLSGGTFQGLFPSRALHRSVDYEELAKRLDVVDKMLSRALRSTHRESFIGKR